MLRNEPFSRLRVIGWTDKNVYVCHLYFLGLMLVKFSSHSVEKMVDSGVGLFDVDVLGNKPKNNRENNQFFSLFF